MVAICPELCEEEEKSRASACPVSQLLGMWKPCTAAGISCGMKERSLGMNTSYHQTSVCVCRQVDGASGTSKDEVRDLGRERVGNGECVKDPHGLEWC